MHTRLKSLASMAILLFLSACGGQNTESASQALDAWQNAQAELADFKTQIETAQERWATMNAGMSLSAEDSSALGPQKLAELDPLAKECQGHGNYYASIRFEAEQLGMAWEALQARAEALRTQVDAKQLDAEAPALVAELNEAAAFGKSEIQRWKDAVDSTHQVCIETCEAFAKSASVE